MTATAPGFRRGGCRARAWLPAVVTAIAADLERHLARIHAICSGDITQQAAPRAILKAA